MKAFRCRPCGLKIEWPDEAITCGTACPNCGSQNWFPVHVSSTEALAWRVTEAERQLKERDASPQAVPLEDLSDDARDRRLQALEETVSLLLSMQDRMVGKMNKKIDPPMASPQAIFPGHVTFVDPIGEFHHPYGYSPGIDPAAVKDARKLQKMTRKKALNPIKHRAKRKKR